MPHHSGTLAAFRLLLMSGASVGVAGALGAAPAAAETPAGQTPSASPELQEVLVTARRREENLQHVPLSVTVLSGSEITRQAIVSPADLNAFVPSLAVVNTTVMRDSAKYVIRGQGQAPYGAEPAVVTYFDEAPTVSTGPGLLFDLENVQVLNGPQGTLFGRNTTGGAILLQSRRPGNDFGGYGKVTLGNYQLRRFELGVDLPIVRDRVLLRLAADVNKRQGYTIDLGNGRRYDGRNYQAYRASLTLKPFDGLRNDTVVNYARSDGTMGGAILVSLDPQSGVAQIPAVAQAFAEYKARGVRVDRSAEPDDFQRIRSFGVTNITTYDATSFLTFKNVLAYRLFEYNSMSDVDGTLAPLVDGVATPYWGSGGDTEPSSRTFTEEFQIQGRALNNALNWLLGAYYEHIQPESDTNKDVFTQFFVGPLVLQSLKRDTSKAVFGQATYDFSTWAPGLKLTGGLRYTADERSQQSSNYLSSAPGFNAVVACTFAVVTPNCTATNAAKFHGLTGNVSIDYQVTRGVLLYGTVRRGYKSGGFNAASPSPTDRVFAPEFVTDYEIGAKTDFHIGDAPARLNIALFRSDLRDYQENGVIFDAPSGQLLTITRNVGQARFQGVEIEGQMRPVEGLSLSGSYSHLDARFIRNTFNGLDLRNIPFQGAPKNKFTITADYRTPIGASIGTLDLSATYSYQSRVFFAVPLVPVDHDPQAGQSGYGLLNLRASLENIGGSGVDVSVFANNLTNKAYKVFENDIYDLAGFSSALFGEPRTFGVSLGYRFGAAANH